MDAIWTIKLIELVLIYGPTVAAQMIQALNTQVVTVEMIEKLLVDPPETYFKDDDLEKNF